MTTLAGKAMYNIGYVKRTEGQKKKHILQMNSRERRFLEEVLGEIDVNELYLSSHVKNKKDTTTISKGLIKEILNKRVSDLIIEYNETVRNGRLERRILLRDDSCRKIKFFRKDGSSFETMANLCFVITTTGKVVTAYWNKVGDNHKSIDFSRYNKGLQIIK